jgi:cephalosporin hydroxylase
MPAGRPFGWVDWKGVRVLKTPDALMLQQELIHETQPEIIVETGTKFGGSAVFYADLHVEVVSIDVACPKPPAPHFLVTYLTGFSTDLGILFRVGELSRDRRTMVVLDSDHSYENVLQELEAYHGFVTPGCYLVVEDLDQGGPQEALDEWLPGHPEFRVALFPGRAPEHGYLYRCS